ncbi:D-aminoacyl-tRNA deacylase [Adlercreutzia sp. ZJ141]|uniref:D-aminoacyl-tRNA deacylase n=1 Tax=Adlercreutzia sp. ZJ141 TaxID=2709406 RepID=UPI0013ECD73C|nr:D-aminoacyl-tRNA deacylase [Adlercreutzia sp. ZJ141]
MRALIQRVTRASVTVDGQVVGSCERGYLIFLGVGHGDSEEQVEQLWSKVSRLRIFEDENGKINRSLADIEGDVLVVSQFTLYATCKRGNRPSFTCAAPPDEARRLYEAFADRARRDVARVETGEFGAMMSVELVNDGPFTIWLDTDEL